MAVNVLGLAFAVCLLYSSTVCNADTVDKFGAKGDGRTDDTQAFLQAWKAACSASGGAMIVPAGKQYFVKPVAFQGPCTGTTSVQVDGTVLAPPDMAAWGSGSSKPTWIIFSRVNGLTISGKGTFDGRGQKWWACKESSRCSKAPTAMTVGNCASVGIQGVSFLNSQQVHLNIQDSKGVHISGITITAPGDSPNTDGVHIGDSSGVTVSSSKIGTGDDCVSIVSGSSNIEVTGVQCGPGHGLSIGSLGKAGATDVVSNITISDSTLTGTTNGARIKTWQGGAGTATGIKFMGLTMKNVQNPIIIDQFYCNSKSSGTCGTSTSSVKISDITFSKIAGTSATPVGVNLHCSQSGGCSGITLDSITLTQSNGSPAQVQCSNAHGNVVGVSSNALSSCLSGGSASAPKTGSGTSSSGASPPKKGSSHSSSNASHKKGSSSHGSSSH